MVNEVKSRQTEGYDFYDYEEVAFNAAGGNEAPYVVGTEANGAVAGAWPSESMLYNASLLTANVAAGVQVVPVAAVAGFVVGQTVYIVDNANIMANMVAVIQPAPVNVLVMALPTTAVFTLANGAFVTNALPSDAQDTELHSDEPCLIRLLSRAAVGRKVLPAASPGQLPAGAFIQFPLPANTWRTVPDKWVFLWVVGAGGNAGTLEVKASG